MAIPSNEAVLRIGDEILGDSMGAGGGKSANADDDDVDDVDDDGGDNNCTTGVVDASERDIKEGGFAVSS